MIKYYVVVSDETNKVGIYTRENGETNCLVLYDLNLFDADNVACGVIEKYTFSDEENISDAEYDKMEEKYLDMLDSSKLIDSEKFEEIINE